MLGYLPYLTQACSFSKKTHSSCLSLHAHLSTFAPHLLEQSMPTYSR